MRHGKFELSKSNKSINSSEEIIEPNQAQNVQNLPETDLVREPKNQPEKETSPAKSLLNYLHDFVALLSAILLVLLLFLRVVVVSGPSMRNTLVDGDYIILLSSAFYSNPEQGDIVVASKDSFKDGEPIIKRVIATEGQEVYIDFDNGIVYVNKKPLDEPYILEKIIKDNRQQLNATQFPLIVDEGCVFVMGDNRNNSSDSRNAQIGQIDCREILGKAVFLLFPGKDDITDKRDFKRIGAFS